MSHPYRLDAAASVLLGLAAELGRDVLGPHAADTDAQARFPRESVDALAVQGFLGLTVASELGGSAQGPGVFAAVVEELAMHCGSTAMIYVMHVAATQAIASSTTLGSRDAVLHEIATGGTPDDARLLGARLALAVLGAGVGASPSATADGSRARRNRG
jgi:alkylation response protein AidB-like acyl-CoA dehydrogenase